MAFSIPQSFINHLLEQCDIVQLIAQEIPVQKKGNNYVACCPFHEEQTPSFTITPQKQFYYCFGCGIGGNVLSFITQYKRIHFIEAVEWLANYLHIAIPKSKYSSKKIASKENLQAIMQAAVEFYHAQLFDSHQAVSYLKTRSITRNTIETFKIGFATETWNGLLNYLVKKKLYLLEDVQKTGLIVAHTSKHYYDRFRSRIIFPIRNQNGQYVGLGGRTIVQTQQAKYLNSPETAFFQKSNELYGLYEACQSANILERIWVVEGYVDVLSLHQSGVTEAVATLGTSTSRSHLLKLFRLSKEIIFCFDGDEAGKKASIRTLELMLNYLQDGWIVKFLKLPLGLDPDSWIHKKQSPSFKELHHQAVALDDFLFQYLKNQSGFTTLMEKNQLIRNALPLLQKINAPIMKAQLFEKLSVITHLSKLQLQNFHAQHRKYRTTPKLAVKNRYSIVDKAIGLLIQQPSVLKKGQSHIDTMMLEKYDPLLYQLIRLIQANHIANSAVLLEYFRKNEMQHTRLLTLLKQDWLIPTQGFQEEFNDILLNLEQSIARQKIEQLLQKAKSFPLKKEEKQELLQLLIKQKTQQVRG